MSTGSKGVKIGDVLESNKNFKTLNTSVKKGNIFKIKDIIEEDNDFILYILSSNNKKNEIVIHGYSEKDLLENFNLVRSERVKRINQVLYQK